MEEPICIYGYLVVNFVFRTCSRRLTSFCQSLVLTKMVEALA